MDKEKNRIKLKKALQELQSYDPPEDLWNHISAGLDQEQDPVLRSALDKLPQYDPPDFVWENIEAEVSEVRKGFRSRRLYRNWVAAATLAILVAFSGWLLFSQESDETIVRMAYSSVEPQNLVREGDTAAEHIETVISEVQKVSHTWNSPRAEMLTRSLDEIKNSIEEFQKASEKYGMNQQMHEQLTSMYNKRNKIVRSLAGMI